MIATWDVKGDIRSRCLPGEDARPAGYRLLYLNFQKRRIAGVSLVNKLTVRCVRLAHLLGPTLRASSFFESLSSARYICLCFGRKSFQRTLRTSQRFTSSSTAQFIHFQEFSSLCFEKSDLLALQSRINSSA